MGSNIPDANALDKFDVIKFAKDMLAEVDQIRAYELIPDDQTKGGLKIPSESRLNAFYRLVGLPMLVTIEDKNKKNGAKKANNEGSRGARVLSPGFFGGKFSINNIKNSETEIKVEGTNQKINNILSRREAQLSKIESSIGTEDSNDRMTKALKDALPLVANISETNSKEYDRLVTVGNTNFKRKVFKKLLPPVTFYKVVLPVRNEIARPFVIEENDKKIDSQTTLKIPFIETVIRIRVLAAANAESTAEQSKNQEFKNSITTLAGAVSIKSFDNLKGGLLEYFIRNKLLAAFVQLAVKWKELKKNQETINREMEYKVSIKTSSSKASLFGKRIEADLDSDSKAARKLNDLETKLAREEILLSLLPTDDTLFKTNTKTASTKNITSAALTNQFVKLITFNADQLRKSIKKEKEYVKKQVVALEKHRVELETITGEFTGLSVPDVLAVISALFTIDVNSLLSLLDAEAINNMKKDKRLKAALDSLGTAVGEPDLTNTILAIEVLTNHINDWYKLLNSVIKVVEDKTKQGRQQKAITRRRKKPRKPSIENK